MEEEVVMVEEAVDMEEEMNAEKDMNIEKDILVVVNNITVYEVVGKKISYKIAQYI